MATVCEAINAIDAQSISRTAQDVSVELVGQAYQIISHADKELERSLADTSTGDINENILEAAIDDALTSSYEKGGYLYYPMDERPADLQHFFACCITHLAFTYAIDDPDPLPMFTGCLALLKDFLIRGVDPDSCSHLKSGEWVGQAVHNSAWTVFLNAMARRVLCDTRMFNTTKYQRSIPSRLKPWGETLDTFISHEADVNVKLRGVAMIHWKTYHIDLAVEESPRSLLLRSMSDAGEEVDGLKDLLRSKCEPYWCHFRYVRFTRFILHKREHEQWKKSSTCTSHMPPYTSYSSPHWYKLSAELSSLLEEMRPLEAQDLDKCKSALEQIKLSVTEADAVVENDDGKSVIDSFVYPANGGRVGGSPPWDFFWRNFPSEYWTGPLPTVEPR
ncbi:hypothetical protein ACLMJK_002906 [Lecanora helva]